MSKNAEQTSELVDETGRVIPTPGMKGVVDADRSFYLTQSDLDYASRLARLQEFYRDSVKFMSAAEFEDRCEAAIRRVGNDLQIANLLKGPHFPFIMPQLQGDLGHLLDGTMVPAMERSSLAQFPDRRFYNYRRGQLTGNVMTVPDTRQERLIEAMTKGSACGVYFPCLQGFDITAAHEMIAARLPETLVLSGMEVPVVITAYPEIIALDVNTPGLDMAGLAFKSLEHSLFYWASDVNAMFGERKPWDLMGDDMIWEGGQHSCGVSVLG